MLKKNYFNAMAPKLMPQIHIKEPAQWLFIDINIFTDRYRFIQEVVFGCRIPGNSDNKGITLKVLYKITTPNIQNSIYNFSNNVSTFATREKCRNDI